MPKEDSKPRHAFDMARSQAALSEREKNKRRRREKIGRTASSKLLWILIGGFTVAILTIVIAFSWIRKSWISSNYTKEMQILGLTVSMDEGYLRADDGEEQVLLVGRNLNRAIDTLSVSDHKVLSRKPSYNEAEAIKLTASTGQTFIVAPALDQDEDNDLAYIIYINEDSENYFSIEGYQTMKWMEDVTGFEGVYGPNEKANVIHREPKE